MVLRMEPEQVQAAGAFGPFGSFDLAAEPVDLAQGWWQRERTGLARAGRQLEWTLEREPLAPRVEAAAVVFQMWSEREQAAGVLGLFDPFAEPADLPRVLRERIGLAPAVRQPAWTLEREPLAPRVEAVAVVFRMWSEWEQAAGALGRFDPFAEPADLPPGWWQRERTGLAPVAMQVEWKLALLGPRVEAGSAALRVRFERRRPVESSEPSGPSGLSDLMDWLPELRLELEQASGPAAMAQREAAGLLLGLRLGLELASRCSEIARLETAGLPLVLPLRLVTFQPSEMAWREAAGASAGSGDVWAFDDGSV